MTDDEQNLMADYRRLLDGLSDMIIGSRLQESLIPDDFEWLTDALARCTALENKIAKDDE